MAGVASRRNSYNTTTSSYENAEGSGAVAGGETVSGESSHEKAVPAAGEYCVRKCKNTLKGTAIHLAWRVTLCLLYYQTFPANITSNYYFPPRLLLLFPSRQGGDRHRYPGPGSDLIRASLCTRQAARCAAGEGDKRRGSGDQLRARAVHTGESVVLVVNNVALI